MISRSETSIYLIHSLHFGDVKGMRIYVKWIYDVTVRGHVAFVLKNKVHFPNEG